MSFYFIAIVTVIIGLGLGWVFTPNHSVVRKRPKTRKRLKPGTKLKNKRGVHYEVTERGGLRNTETIGEFLDHPNVRKQLKAMDGIFKQQTIMALRMGTQPPHLVGVGTYTKKSLLRDWDDEWQSVLEDMNEHIDITYNSFFDIPEEHPDAGIVYTADEIVNKYGREEENS